MSNKKLIKNLLATASAIAVLASGASAFAAVRDTGGDTELQNVSGAGAFINNDAIKYTGVHTVTVDGAGGRDSIVQIDTQNKAAVLVIDGGNLAALGTVMNSNGADGSLAINYAALHTVTFTGANLGHSAGAGAAIVAANGLNVGGPAKASVAIDFGANANAAFVVNKAGAVLDQVSFAGNNQGVVQVSDNATFKNVVTVGGNAISTVKVDAGKTLTLETGTDLTIKAIVDGVQLVGDKAGLVVNNGAKSGALKILAGGTATYNNNSEGGNVVVDAAGVVTLNDTSKVNNVTLTAAGTLNLNSTNVAAANEVTITDGGTVNLTQGTVAKVIVTTAKSEVNLAGGTLTTLHSANPNAGIVTVSGDVAVTQFGSGNAIASLNFDGDNTLTLGVGGAHEVTAITTNVDGEGKIILGKQDLTVKTVGSADKALNSLTFSGAARTVTVKGGTFNVKTVDGSQAIGAADTVIDFQETVDVSKVVFGSESGRVIGKIKVSGDKEVAFGGSLKNVKALTFDNANGKATISSVGNVAFTLDAGGAGQGQVTFDNEAALELATIGAVNKLNIITLAGSNVKVAGDDAKMAKLVFGAKTDTTVFEVKELDDIGAFEGTDAKSGTVAFRADSTLAGDFGTKDKSFTALSYVTDAAAALDVDGKNIHALVQAKTADKLTLNNVGAAADTTYGGFGSVDARMLDVQFAANAGKTATVTGGTFSKKVSIDETAVVFGGTVNGVDAKTSEGIVFGHANSTVTFKTKANLLNMKAVANAANEGSIVFEGSHYVGSDLGAAGKAMKSVKFTGDAKTFVALNANVYAENLADSVQLGKGVFLVGMTEDEVAAFDANPSSVLTLNGTDLTVSGQVKADASTIILPGNTLTLDANANLTNAKIVAVYNGTDMGKVSAAGKTITGLDTVQFNFVSSFAPNKTIKAYVDFTDANKSLDKLNGNIGGNGGLTAWKFAVSEGNGATTLDLISNTDVAGFAGANNITGKNLSVLTQLTQAPTGDALDVVNFISLNPENADEALGRLTASVSASAATAGAASSVTDAIGTRMSSTGTSSGDEDGKMGFGVWASGFGAKSTQKARKGDAGYKGNVMGGTVGADTMVSDASTLGIAVSYASSELKFKDAKAGDKTKSTNMFFNVYGRHEMANNWFMQGSAGFGSGNVKSTVKTALLQAASAKYDTMAFSMEALAGYNYKIADGASLVPAAGIRYMNVNEGGYTEKGKAGRTITKKATDKITGILGAGVQGAYDMSGTVVAPEAHAYVNYDLKAKNPKVEAKIDGLSSVIDITSSKPSKVSYNVGTSLTAKTGTVEYGVGYDARLGNKFVSHQGTLRLRVDL